MKKFCVFCGKYPISKNREHVIPQWLIKYTGDPNRKAAFGLDWRRQKVREFAFSEFTFPACTICNDKFGELEKIATEVMMSMLNEESLPSEAFSIFLTWLDKVRVGLWLGLLCLDKNIFGVQPHFYVKSRIDTTDRMVLIYKMRDHQRGIFLPGITNPFFGFKPSFFCLGINQFHFVNIASDFLFSRRLGLPFLRNLSWNEQGSVQGELTEGLRRIYFPLIRKYYDKSCTEIFQPVIHPGLFHNEHYKNRYVRKFFSASSNLGKVLITADGKVVSYGGYSQRWIPKILHDGVALLRITLDTLQVFQNLFIEETPSLKALGLKSKYIRSGIKISKKYWEVVKKGIKEIN